WIASTAFCSPRRCSSISWRISIFEAEGGLSPSPQRGEGWGEGRERSERTLVVVAVVARAKSTLATLAPPHPTRYARRPLPAGEKRQSGSLFLHASRIGARAARAEGKMMAWVLRLF